MNLIVSFKRWLIVSLGTAFFMIAAACATEPVEVNKEVAQKVEIPDEIAVEVEIDDLISSLPVTYLFDQENPVGMSFLNRSEAGLQVSMTASGLIPGSALNLWLIVFNHPENCVRGPFDCGLPDHGTNRDAKADFLHVPGTGIVVGEDGEISLSGSIDVNDPSYSGWPEFPTKCPAEFPDCGNPVGLINPQGALVRVMLHSNGPAAEGEILEAQLNSYIGRCQNFIGSLEGNFSGSLGEIPSVAGECASILNATHHPEDAEIATSE